MVVEVDGVAVGFLRWGLFWDQVPFMNLLWVLPDWRGKGVGTTLVHAWEKSQLAAGHSLVLTSTVSAETSQHLYRRLGYVDSGALLLPDERTGRTHPPQIPRVATHAAFGVGSRADGRAGRASARSAIETHTTAA
jgi:N-acetylglutamate synthase-like GNAT family acetyltransferase